jgi:predicted membrane protein
MAGLMVFVIYGHKKNNNVRATISLLVYWDGIVNINAVYLETTLAWNDGSKF